MQRYKGKVGGIKVQVVDIIGVGDVFCVGILSSFVKDFGIIDVSIWFLMKVENYNFVDFMSWIRCIYCCLVGVYFIFFKLQD